MTALAPAVVFLVLNLAGGEEADDADRAPAAHEKSPNAERAFIERWHLRLVPGKCPEIDRSLLATEWSQRSARDILGRGIDHFIRFPAPRVPNGARSIELKTVQHHSVNTQLSDTIKSAKHGLTIGGPFLEYDGLLHTAYVSKEVLVPDAIIEVAERKWYTAVARRAAERPDAEPQITLTEYLFEFDDDPIEIARGTLTLHRHVRKLSEPTGRMTRFASTFALFRHARDDRAPYELQIGTPEQHSVTAWFYAGKHYALLREEPLGEKGVFRPEKAGIGD